MTDKTQAYGSNETSQMLGIIIFAIALITTIFTVSDPGVYAFWTLFVSIPVMIIAGYYGLRD